jgi:hypothetical protein
MSQSKKSKEIRPVETTEPVAPPEDELIHVPKGSSRLRFYLVLALTIFVLLVFVVAEPLMSTAGGRSDADQAFMRWTTLDGRERSLSRADFMSEKLRFGHLDDVIMRSLGLAATRIQQDEEAARLILMDDLAGAWGIEITDRELAEQLREYFGPGLEGYDLYIRRFRTLSKANFEAVLRRAMRIQRFEMLLASGVAIADPQTLVQRWQERNKEFAFDYIELLSTDFFDPARAEVPPDPELEAWLMSRSEVERGRFMRAASHTADAAYLPVGADLDGTLLLERYPRPADEDPVLLARDYYDRFTHVRFQRPEPLPEQAGGEDEEGQDPAEPLSERDRIYFTFEEVQDRALTEAPLYFSMVDWLAGLRERAADGVDFVQEAAELGLQYDRLDTPYSRQEWMDEVERPWVGRFLIGSHQNVEPGQFVPRVVVEERAIVVSRVLERFPRALPPFPTIREDVADAWAAAQATQFALRKLEDFYEQLRQESSAADENGAVVVSEERFAKLAPEAGLEVLRREYRERFAPDVPGEPTAQLEGYLRISSGAFAAQEGEVLPPGANRAGSHAFMLRMVGVRDADISKMKPDEVETIRNQIRQQRLTSFFQETYRSPEFLAERHGLWLRSFDE